MTTSLQLDRIARPWGDRTPYAADESWPVRVDTHLAPGTAPAGITDDTGTAHRAGAAA